MSKKGSSSSGTGAATERFVVQVESPIRRIIQHPLQHTIRIGRRNEEEQEQPDLDLDLAGAKQAGVSRLHARLTYQDDALYIEDLDSTNGTRINGFELTAGKSYRLTPTDEIELGSMRITVRIVR